jgi:hypothetical protein
VTSHPKLEATNRAATHAVPASVDRFNAICSIRIDLLNTKPLIWREVEVPTLITLNALHHVIQIVMGWLDRNFWYFTICDERFAPPRYADQFLFRPPKNPMRVRLCEVLQEGQTKIEYLYNHGDSWQHLLTVTNVRQGNSALVYPRYVAGEWAGPPEDCGGTYGFNHILVALSNPNHPDHANTSVWLSGYDAESIDKRRLEIALGRIAKHHKAARNRRIKLARSLQT